MNTLPHTRGPYRATEFKCSDGSECPGVMSETTGAAVCWASGSDDVQSYANARRIAKALNDLDRRDAAMTPTGEDK